jgi:glutamate-1-semialdehyde 2,1-aminomutase
MKAYFIQLMLEQGFLASSLYYAMYAHTDEHVHLYLKAVDKAFAELAAALERMDLKDKLEGQPASAGFKRLT